MSPELSPTLPPLDPLPAPPHHPEWRKTLGHDFFSSIVVFLVALPLCMGIAIASGVPPAAGLITGIIGGIIVGSIAGSPLQVSGPAAGLTVLIAEIIGEHGIASLGLIVLLAGGIQLVAGLLKLGSWFRAISPAVVQGMLAGIGILIIGSQIHVLVDDAPRSTGIGNILAIPEAIWKGIVPLDGSVHHLAAALGLLTIVVMFVWSYLPKKVKVVPAPLVAVVVATVVDILIGLPVKNIEVPANLLSTINFPDFAAMRGMLSWSLVGSAVAVALIASAETLLSATAVDRMHTGPRTRYNRELLAQGVGNSICGLLGSLPMTGVIVRSSANVESGAKTRLSTMLHGIWILGFVMALPFVLNMIPRTALAAILVYTGFKLLNVQAIRELRKFSRIEVIIYFVTVIGIVTTNLLEGVLIGVGLSLLALVYRMTHIEARLIDGKLENHKELHIAGSATFVGLPKIAEKLDEVPPGCVLHVYFDDLVHVDHACFDLLSNWRPQHEATGGQLFIEWDVLRDRYAGKLATTVMEMRTDRTTAPPAVAAVGSSN